MREMETILKWEGALDNSRVREVFGVQAVQASRLLAEFIKTHIAVTRATPKAPLTLSRGANASELAGSPDDYFRLLRPGEGLDSLPMASLEDARMDLAAVNPELFALLTRACHAGTGVDVVYASMTHPKGVARTIFPHTLVRVPRRWHARAWCDLRKDFRDFALGRISSATPVPTVSPRHGREDRDWNRHLTLELCAHPGLSEDQQCLIQREYFGGQRRVKLRVRRAVAGYVVQDLRVSLDVERQKPPQYQLHLKNLPSLGGELPMST
jgi:WYL domain